MARLSKITDHAITLRKLYKTDKIKIDYTLFDKVVDTRSRLLGEPDENVKAELLARCESEFDALLKDYNPRIDMRKKSFKYVAWGIELKTLIEDYCYYKDLYRNTAKEYDDKIKWFPMSIVAKREKYEKIPVPGECSFSEVSLRTEKYIPEDLKDYKVMEKVLKDKK